MSKDDAFEPLDIKKPATKKVHPGLEDLKAKAVIAKKIAPKNTAAIFAKDVKDQELAPLLEMAGPGHHKMVGFLNGEGVLFPTYMKGKDFHICWQGNVVVNKCPKCGHRNSAEEAIKGVCSNERVPPHNDPCGFDMVALLEEITDPKQAEKYL